jgi:soluble P-type ATPase
VKKTLETLMSSKIKINIISADNAVSVIASNGDNKIIALEFSTLGISLIISFHLQP